MKNLIKLKIDDYFLMFSLVERQRNPDLRVHTLIIKEDYSNEGLAFDINVH